jgi:hypothetical protein
MCQRNEEYPDPDNKKYSDDETHKRESQGDDWS